jgi:hypothetical protein
MMGRRAALTLLKLVNSSLAGFQGFASRISLGSGEATGRRSAQALEPMTSTAPQTLHTSDQPNSHPAPAQGLEALQFTK